MAGREAQPPCRNVGGTRQDARDIGAQFGLRRIIVDKPAGIDAADAAAARQADVPNPARGVRGSDGLRRDRAARRDRHLRRERAIVEQYVAAVDPFDAEMAADQQRRMAAAIDEQVAVDVAMLPRRDRRDAALAVALDAGDMIGDMPDAQPLHRVRCQQRGELSRVEMIGVIGGTLIIGH